MSLNKLSAAVTVLFLLFLQSSQGGILPSVEGH